MIDYRPTFGEKLLGSNYKWWYILQFKFKSRTTSVFDNALFVTGQIIILLGSLVVWWLANNKIIDTSLQEKWTYFVIGELFLNFVFNFAEFEGFDILRGNVTTDLLRPQKYLKQKFFDTYGEATLQNLIKGFVLISILVLLILTKNISYFNLNNFLFLLLMIPIALVIIYLVGITAAFSAFFLKQINGVILNFGYLINLLMGRIFPLDLLISNFWINFCNPFAYIFYHLMQIYLGKYNLIETIWTLLGGFIWCLVLYQITDFVLKIGLKKNESVGL